MGKVFSFKIRGSVYVVPLEDIVYMENRLRKIAIHLTDGEPKLFYGTFRDVMEDLDERFFCCGRSYIVNLSHIRVLRENGNYELIMDTGRHITLSKNGFLRVRHRLEDWLRQRQAHPAKKIAKSKENC